MAGDFVMVQFATPRKPEVLRVAAIMGIDAPHAFGLCVIAWMWFDEQTEDGRAFGATEPLLDAVVGRAGFASALREVGWLQVREGSLVVPNFDRLMGQSAKKRAKNTVRQQELRRSAPVTEMSRIKRDKSATKEEKRREEKSKGVNPLKPPAAILPNDLPAILATDEFRTALTDWLAYKGERRESYQQTGMRSMIAMAANRAERFGLRAVVDAMRTAMANNWQGWDQASLFSGGANGNRSAGSRANDSATRSAAGGVAGGSGERGI